MRKPKLSEDQLAEKMARIKIKNASLTEAHAKAEADAASFAQREEQVKELSAKRQKEERKDRQQMMGEREKNRLRKLKATEGREWDAKKNDEDFQRGGRYDKKGGFPGDSQDYNDGREYLLKEPRGGGDTNRGGARGAKAQAQNAPKQDDFPALPPAVAKADAGQVATADESTATPQEPAGVAKSEPSWADQVESTV